MLIVYGSSNNLSRKRTQVNFFCDSVGNKIGGGLVSALLTGLLTMAGYISSTAADVVQPQSAVDMIVSIYCYGVLVIWEAVILVLYSWKLDKIYPQIVSDLAERASRGEM